MADCVTFVLHDQNAIVHALTDRRLFLGESRWRRPLVCLRTLAAGRRQAPNYDFAFFCRPGRVSLSFQSLLLLPFDDVDTPLQITASWQAPESVPQPRTR